MLVVDQFEEVFTLCRDEHERTDFLDALVGLTEDSDPRVQVVVAVRADFYGRCAAHDRLARLVGANQVLVGPMQPDELQRAIVEPARRVGLRVEPSLADALITDVLDEPGGLQPAPTGRLRSGTPRRGSRSGTPLTLEPETFVSADFSPDGSNLFAVSTSGEGLRLKASPESWKRHACVVAGRDLTAQEWKDVLPDRPYRTVCSSD